MAKKFKQVLPADAPSKLQLSAGMLLRTFDPTATELVFDADAIIGLTSGGLNIKCEPNRVDHGDGVDGGKPNMKGYQHITHYNCTLSGTLITGDADVSKLTMGYANVTDDGAGTITIKPLEGVVPDDFFTDVWVVGPQGANGTWAVNLKNVFTAAGFEQQTADKEKATFTMELAAFYDTTKLDEVPMDFYQLTDVAEGI